MRVSENDGEGRSLGSCDCFWVNFCLLILLCMIHLTGYNLGHCPRIGLQRSATLERLIVRSSHHLDMERLIGRSAYLILEGQICLLLC